MFENFLKNGRGGEKGEICERNKNWKYHWKYIDFINKSRQYKIRIMLIKIDKIIII